MALKDLDFSDAILFSKGEPGALLKTGPGVSPPPGDCAEDVRGLLAAVTARYRGADLGQSFRLEHHGCLYRTAAFPDVRYGTTFFLRRLANHVATFESLGLPRVLSDWLLGAEQRQGLLLIAGSQGSGKTTTAASLIKARLEQFGGHGVTFENPVELPLAGPHGPAGFCFQSEIASEEELEAAIERTHRYGSPNVIFIGEIKSQHAASVALQVALGSSRQLVVATIHGMSVIDALTRLLNWAREKDPKVANQNLAQTLLGVIRQELIVGEGGQRELELADLLLLPFSGGDDVMGLRNKIQEDKLLTLGSDINFQFQRLRNGLI